MECFHVRVLYYWRHGLYGHVKLLCQDGFETMANDLFTHVWNALALGMEGKTKEALIEISRMECRSDLALLYVVCRMFIIKSSSEPDNEILENLSSQLDSLIPKSNSFSASTTVQVAWMFNDLKLAEYIIRKTPEKKACMPMEGWVKLNQAKYTEGGEIFDRILSEPNNATNILALYGKAVQYSAMGKFTECQQTYARLLAYYNFPEMNLEKARVYCSMYKWNLAAEISEDVRDLLPSSIEVEIFQVLNYMFRESDLISAVKSLDLIIDKVTKIESTNWKYIVKLAMAFGTLSSNSLHIINKSIKLAQYACKIAQSNSLCYAVNGYHQYLTRNTVVAMNLCQKSLEIDESNFFAIETQMLLMLTTGRENEVEDELELYKYTGDQSIQILAFDSYLNRKKCKENDLDALIYTIAMHLNAFDSENAITSKFTPLELSFERILDSIIFFRIDSIVFALDEIITNNNTLKIETLYKIEEPLKKLLTILPNFPPIKLMQAIQLNKVGKYEEALSAIQTLLISNWDYRLPFCLITCASLNMELGNGECAKLSLDEALSYDPSLALNPLYAILHAKLDQSPENLNKVQKLITGKDIALTHGVSFIDLAIKIKDFARAREVFKAITPKVQQLHEKAELVIRQAYILANDGNIKRAFENLKKLEKSSQYYIHAIVTKAHITRDFLHDHKASFDLINSACIKHKNKLYYSVFGDELYEYLDFAAAAVAYGNAISLSQKGSNELILVTKRVMSLVNAHYFDDAVKVFSSSLVLFRGSSHSPFQLIEQLIKLQRYSDAKKCLEIAHRLIHPNQIIQNCEYLEQYGFVCMKLKENAESEKSYLQCLNLYNSIFNRGAKNCFINILKKRTSNLCYELGQLYDQMSNKEKSVEYYQMSLTFDSSNSDSVCALYKYYKMRLDVTKCLKLCTDYLTEYPHNETIALLLTSLETHEYTTSIQCLENVLKFHPQFHRALVRLIEICARAGKMHVVQNRITDDHIPGMIFSKGVYLMYKGEPKQALSNFRKIETDRRWGQAAKIEKFHLLVNPDRKYIWCETEPLSNEEDLKKADNLLTSLDLPKLDKMILNAKIIEARNTEYSVGEAIKLYKNALEIDHNSIACIVGTAACSIRLNDNATADKMIDKVLNGKPFHETFSFFEEAYLMRSYIVFQKDKNYRASQHFNFLALDLNMSCKKGWEMCATTHKENKMFAEAAKAYWHCWNLSGQKDIEIGYQYAYCSMMADKPDEALSMARKIMIMEPCYKNIREDIIIPSFRNLRP